MKQKKATTAITVEKKPLRNEEKNWHLEKRMRKNKKLRRKEKRKKPSKYSTYAHFLVRQARYICMKLRRSSVLKIR